MENTPAEKTVALTLVLDWIQDVRSHLEHELDQAIWKRDLYLAVQALGGRDGVDRVKRQIEMRLAMFENAHKHELLKAELRSRKRKAV